MLIDLHVQAPSDAAGWEKVADAARLAGLDGVAVVLDDAFPSLPAAELSGIRFFAGARLTTDRGLYVVFVPEASQIADVETLLGPRDVEGQFVVRTVLARANALEGAVVAVRPYDLTLARPGGDILYTLPGLAAVEVVSPVKLGGLSHAAVEAAETLGLPSTGGSGAIAPSDVGRAATLFSDPIASTASLVAALKGGRCWSVDLGAPSSELGRRSPPPPREGGQSAGSGEHRRRRRRR
jgi:hypothetical protein